MFQLNIATDKLAILFGQSNYRGNNKQLPAAKNDLYEAHKVFSSFGFKTISCLDNTLDEMKKVVHFAIDMMRDSANNNLYGEFTFVVSLLLLLLITIARHHCQLVID